MLFIISTISTMSRVQGSPGSITVIQSLLSFKSIPEPTHITVYTAYSLAEHNATHTHTFVVNHSENSKCLSEG